MLNSPYGGSPFYQPQPSPYLAAIKERKAIRSTVSQVCWIALLGIILYTALMKMAGLFLNHLGFMYNPNYQAFNGIHPILYYLITGFAYIFGLAVPPLLYFAVKHLSLSQMLPFRKAGVVRTAAYVFFGTAICLLANIPANLVVNLEKFFGYSGNIPESPLTNDWTVLALYTVTVAIIPPIVEELVFRGMILQSLRRFGDSFAVLASALLFGLYHGNVVQFVFAFCCGLVMGLVDVRANSLLPSILIHFLTNSFSLAVQFTQRLGGKEAALQTDSVLSLSILGLGLLSLLYLFLREKDFFRIRSSFSALRFSQKMGALFMNTGAVIVVLYGVASSIYVLNHY